MADDDNDVKRNKRPKPRETTKPKKYIAPDGLNRSLKVEHRINEAFAIVFRDAAGQLVRDYLKSISVNQVMPPGSDPDLITYHEGARWLMGIIDTRIKQGEDKKP